MYGFYITQKGIEKLAKAANEGTKLDIKKIAVGNGGDAMGERNYNITALVSEVYRKTLDMEDTYSILEDAPNTLYLETIIPDSAGDITINEYGYFDTDDDLIFYGVTKDISKSTGSDGQEYLIDLISYIELSPNEIDSIHIGPDAQSIADILERVIALETELEGMAEFLESRI